MIQKQVRQRLAQIAKDRAEKALKKSAKKLGKTGVKKGPKVIPIVGNVFAVGVIGYEIFWEGRHPGYAIGEGIVDAIPIVGNIKAGVEIGGGVIEVGGSALGGGVDEKEVQDKIWEELAREGAAAG